MEKSSYEYFVTDIIAATRSASLLYPPFLGQPGGASNALKSDPDPRAELQVDPALGPALCPSVWYSPDTNRGL